ncbi:MAG: phage holin family protein [Methylocystaceae bacterium]
MYYLLLGLGCLLSLEAASLLPGAVINSLSGAIIGAVVLLLLYLLVRPFLLLILLPINMLTLGLFSLLINTWMVLLADKMVPGINVGGFWNALVPALLIMLISSIIRRWQYHSDTAQ